jgi:hypothetical protein
LRLRAFLSLAVCSTAITQAPALARPSGHYLDAAQAAASRPAQYEDTTGEYTYSIRRAFPDSAAERLLGIAEATYPSRGTLVRIAEANGYEMGPDTAGADLWWCKGPGESRVPYAVTVGALEHYLKLTQLYRERKFSRAGTRPIFCSQLVYRATIAHRERFTLRNAEYSDVYVAHLTLIWTYDDGTFTPYAEGHRIVVLASSGEVLAVDGDGSAEERVTISSHRGIGRHEQILR